MPNSAKLNFIEQQELIRTSNPACELQYTALMFQPRLVGGFVLAALIFQSWVLFLTLSAVLWWNVSVPALNPFNAVYNRFVAGPKGTSATHAGPGTKALCTRNGSHIHAVHRPFSFL